jgi:hypothetical protein
MSRVIVGRPEKNEYTDYYSGYVARVPEDDLSCRVTNAMIWRFWRRDICKDSAFFFPPEWVNIPPPT